MPGLRQSLTSKHLAPLRWDDARPAGHHHRNCEQTIEFAKACAEISKSSQGGKFERASQSTKRHTSAEIVQLTSHRICCKPELRSLPTSDESLRQFEPREVAKLSFRKLLKQDYGDKSNTHTAFEDFVLPPMLDSAHED